MGLYSRDRLPLPCLIPFHPPPGLQIRHLTCGALYRAGAALCCISALAGPAAGSRLGSSPSPPCNPVPPGPGAQIWSPSCGSLPVPACMITHLLFARTSGKAQASRVVRDARSP